MDYPGAWLLSRCAVVEVWGAVERGGVRYRWLQGLAAEPCTPTGLGAALSRAFRHRQDSRDPVDRGSAA